jgi:hypothetical protein
MLLLKQIFRKTGVGCAHETISLDKIEILGNKIKRRLAFKMRTIHKVTV